MDSVTTSTKLGGPERTEKIAQLAKEIMLANGVGAEFFTSHSPAWTESVIAARDAAFAEAQIRIEAEHGVPSWSPPNADTNVEVDWSQEPEVGLATAKREYISALRSRDDAAAVAYRARQRVEQCEAELMQYSDLNLQIEAHHILAARNDTTMDLPYHLSSALRDQAVQLDIFDHATKAQKTLESELRTHERQLQARLYAVAKWSERIVIMRAELVASELAAIQGNADHLRHSLDSLAHCAFPYCQGGVPITHKLLEAIQSTSAPRQDNPDQALKQHWLDMHASLMGDGDVPT